MENRGYVYTCISRSSEGRKGWLLHEYWRLRGTAPPSSPLVPSRSPRGDGWRLNEWRMMEGSEPQAFQIVPGALTCYTQSLVGGGGRVLYRRMEVFQKVLWYLGWS